MWCGGYLQTANFERVYAAYGGIFIFMALIWAWKVDGFKPDRGCYWGLHHHLYAEKIGFSKAMKSTSALLVCSTIFLSLCNNSFA
ncbi:hypothetical protein [Mucilaginibacter sp.]|uniref:hypothetical protein n=1 Tax=Mucilaginibacter sp. TaxID=1882438 RepID=UPI003263F8F6